MGNTRTMSSASGREWQVRPEAAGPILARPWPDFLDSPLTNTAPGLDLVKRGRGRAVFRFTAGGRMYYVKDYRPAGLGRRLRAWVGRGPARREWEALLAALAAGLDVPEPVALAGRWAERLVTSAVPGERLDEYLFSRFFEPLAADPPYPGARPSELVAVFRHRREPPEETIRPRILADLLADLVARLAEADLALPDLHPGNLLLSGEGMRWRLRVVDLASAVRPAPAGSILDHLVRLEHFFEPITSTSERLRCHRRVLELLGRGPRARWVTDETAEYRRGFYRGRDRRTRRESKYFCRLAAGGWRGWATADWAERIAHLAASGDPSAGAEAVKVGRTAEVRRARLEGGGALYLKRHKRASGLGRSRSLKAFRAGHALLARGIATARPAAALDRRTAGMLTDTILATEPVEGEPLSDWLRSRPAASERRRMARRLAHLLQRMHAAGFSHRDLKAPNLLVSPAHGRWVRPVLVDLDGLAYKGTVSPRRRAKDLMRLSVSLEEWGVARTTDRLRFLRAYLAPPGAPAPITTRGRRRGDTEPGRRLGRWWRRIERLSVAKRQALSRKAEGIPAP